MRRCVFFLVCLWGAWAQQTFVQVNNNTKYFIDPQGRTLLFHGVNAVYKIAPWMPETEGFDPQLSLSATDIDNLANWGFNFVRLGMMWPGVEPEQGMYNTTYLEAMKGLVDALGQKGIYTLLDCHQDVLTRYFCGEGIPDWAYALVANLTKMPFPEPVHAPFPTEPGTGYPQLSSCLNVSFSEYYLTEAVARGFQDLYSNVEGLQDSFAAFWQQVASVFSENPYVVGYELINEPFAGDWYTHPEYIIPQKADAINLMPMYQNLHTAIREIDDSHIIFFEPTVSDLVIECGFHEGPGGPAYNDRQVYSYHVYCAPDNYTGDPTLLKECELVDDLYFFSRTHDMTHMKVGGMMTEFGAMEGNDIGLADLNYILGKADGFIQGWAYWQFKSFNDITTQSTGPYESFYDEDGNLYTAKVKALARTYAPIIAGTPIVHKFDPVSAVFTLTYTIDATISPQYQQTTINFVPSFYYPSGVRVTLVPAGLATYSQPAFNRLVVQHAPSATGVLTVTVSQM